MLSNSTVFELLRSYSPPSQSSISENMFEICMEMWTQYKTMKDIADKLLERDSNGSIIFRKQLEKSQKHIKMVGKVT